MSQTGGAFSNKYPVTKIDTLTVDMMLNFHSCFLHFLNHALHIFTLELELRVAQSLIFRYKLAEEFFASFRFYLLFDAEHDLRLKFVDIMQQVLLVI